eukprot:CAMPEP_0119016704 /NCGR_PEP_ID=MMETSP1176-20130426/14181_1 /TAXON_ID=265551 /ORGANISM="Synedropsis recta cf, Strain CCMP1620" /LENGTH=349 /DNA_ID=CAMNT_0006970225 /DNA_START=199 /DNA_END=1248 /DNA_ORIENTATION=+
MSNDDDDADSDQGFFSDEEVGGEQQQERNHNKVVDKEEQKRLALLVPCLANRAFHLPGNGWCQDWWQYTFANNHALFSLFCANQAHPVTKLERILVLLSSIAASLAISSGFYIVFLIKDNGYIRDSTQFVEDDTIILDGVITYSDYELAVLTVGAALHTMFDMAIWVVAACQCCEAGGTCRQQACQQYSWSGTVALVVILAGVSTLTVLLMLLYGTIENGIEGIDADADANYTQAVLDRGFLAIDIGIAISDAGTKENNHKWLTWLMQLGISFFVYDLLVSTILFSGIFGCLECVPLVGPMLGGRPLEIRNGAKAKRKAARKKKSKKRRKSSSRRSSSNDDSAGIDASE